MRSGFHDVVPGNGEILTQHRHVNRGARGLQIRETSLKVAPVRKHRQRGGPTAFIGCGNRGGIEFVHKHASAGRSLLNLGDDGGPRAGKGAREGTAVLDRRERSLLEALADGLSFRPPVFRDLP